jgi:hypothetical protein
VPWTAGFERLSLAAKAFCLAKFSQTRDLALENASNLAKAVKIGAEVVNPRALRHPPVGRGRGVAADVC